MLQGAGKVCGLTGGAGRGISLYSAPPLDAICLLSLMRKESIIFGHFAQIITSLFFVCRHCIIFCWSLWGAIESKTHKSVCLCPYGMAK